LKTHLTGAAMFAAIFCAMAFSLALSEVLLLLAMDQGLPAAGLLAAGVAGYAAGHCFARRAGTLPTGAGLAGQAAVIFGVIFAVDAVQPALIAALIGPAAPMPPFQMLLDMLRNSLLFASGCIALASLRGAARSWIEERGEPAAPA